MEKEIIIQMNKNFEDAAYQEGVIEYWTEKVLQCHGDFFETH